MRGYIPVAVDVGDDPIYIPIEDDGTLTFSTVNSQFPGTCGLQFQCPKSQAWCAVKLAEEYFFPPKFSGWAKHIYYIVRDEYDDGEYDEDEDDD